jgi:hypothetical protein
MAPAGFALTRLRNRVDQSRKAIALGQAPFPKGIRLGRLGVRLIRLCGALRLDPSASVSG